MSDYIPPSRRPSAVDLRLKGGGERASGSVEKSIEFYKKLLGIEPSKVRTGYAKFDVQNPPLNFTLNQHNFTEQGALSHLGIQVASTDDVLAIREQWISRLVD